MQCVPVHASLSPAPASAAFVRSERDGAIGPEVVVLLLRHVIRHKAKRRAARAICCIFPREHLSSASDTE